MLRLVLLCVPPVHEEVLLVFYVLLGGMLRLVLLCVPPAHEEVLLVL